jgi:hypothetical protein
VQGAFTFDGYARLIICNDGVTSVSVEEMYSRWCDWVAQADNFKWAQAIRYVGGDAISATKNLGVTFFLINGWRIRPYEGDHRLVVEGNLYTDPAGQSPFVTTRGGFNVTVEMQVSSLVDSSLAQMAEIEHASFGGRVTVDTVSGVSGTTYPIGTQSSPVNNLADAQAIAAARGFDSFYVIGNLTFGATDNVSNQHFYGQGATLNVTKSLFTFTEGCITTNTHYHHARITGRQGGESNYFNCIIDGLWNAHCHYQDCGMVSPSTLAYTIQQSGGVSSTHITDLHNCYSDEGTVVIDRNGARLNQRYVSYSGDIKFINQNHPTASGSVWINMSGGTVTIDASCTGGTFKISGNCAVVNQSGGAIVDMSQVSASVSGGIDYQALAAAILSAAQVTPIHSNVVQGQAGVADAVWNKQLP